MSVDARGAGQAVGQEAERAAERARRLRAERGALLARRGGGRAAPVVTRPYLVCACGSERYGLPLDAVSGVLPMRAPTPVPGAVPALLGLAVLSGRIVGVIGLARALARPGPDPEAGHLVRLHPAVHRSGTGPAALACALAVDRALGVAHVPMDAVPTDAVRPDGAGGGAGAGAGAGLGDGLVLGYAPAGPEAEGLGDFAILDLPGLLRRTLPPPPA